MTMTRRDFIHLSGLAALGLALPDTSEAQTPTAAPTELFFYVGTYTSGGSEGIYLGRLDMATGALQRVGVTKGVAEPSFLALEPKGRYLYAVNELSTFQGKPSGAVSAFSINPQTRALTLINQQPSRGGAPCHLQVDATGAFVLVANYSGGNVAVLPIQAGGGLGAAVDVKQFQGSGQSVPHAHQAQLDADNQYAFVPDLGTDKVMSFRFDSALGKLTAGNPAFVSTLPGAGPRHLAFHPNGRFAYVINELNSTINTYAYDKATGKLTELQRVSALPDGFTGQSYCAEVRVSPDGRFLYGSNRGHESIVVFSIGSSGTLTYVQHVFSRIQWPRDFIIDPTGTFLLVANQKGNTVVAFRRDTQTGKLTQVGQPLGIPAPTSILVIPPPA
ncbi:lactonase family protein [Melittangium boletus]|uniref:6-phosphogluconolactonase n=1 Tax=Melittangium boletus DSM 14713 TaxID=1294270 RepID=A0A250IR76_9BACT|nr:lactonase family protein [Melittangium boletus]ATB33436.1 6-phosphogluconolactonase [Melittangium boletus DSM 14713]